MFLKDLLFKPNFIAFYKEDNIYKVLNEQYKKEEIIFSENKEFENKKEFLNYISSVIENNPQTYISTFISTPNQGIVPSCEKHIYKDYGIELNNVKTVCINNKYSFYITIFELMELKKEYKYIDFLYSSFALIDYKSSLRHNSLYILFDRKYSYILIYQEYIPIFSDIFDLTYEKEQTEEIEDISDIDIVEDFNSSLDEDIENIDENKIENEEENIENLNVEYKITEHIKTAIKEYYESGGDFIEKIFIFDTIGIQKNITDIINDELFIEVSLEKFELLKTINEISKKNV
jgi:hypothetical protein